MNTTIDARVTPPVALPSAEAPNLLHFVPIVRPSFLVLQPDGSLNQANSGAFQHELEGVLEQVTDGVVVDLLKVGLMDAYGIAALVAGIQCATALGKWMSLQALDANSCLALETEWAQQQECRVGFWKHTFNSSLEAFLDDFMQG
jgi:anti-anti-sigma regulatory factor